MPLIDHGLPIDMRAERAHFLADGLAVTPGLAEQDSGLVGLFGDGFWSAAKSMMTALPARMTTATISDQIMDTRHQWFWRPSANPRVVSVAIHGVLCAIYVAIFTLNSELALRPITLLIFLGAPVGTFLRHWFKRRRPT